MKVKKSPKKVFIDGPISPDFISNSIAKHQSKTSIGAHQIFLGQVREDQIENKNVKAIDYTAYEEMAELEFSKIREKAFEKFELNCLHIYHSLRIVKTGEICLFVFTSSEHRAMAFDSCRFITEEIKANIPVFGKELFQDDSHQWKVNN